MLCSQRVRLASNNEYICLHFLVNYHFSFYVDVFEPCGTDSGIKNEIGIWFEIFSNGRPALPMSFVRCPPTLPTLEEPRGFMWSPEWSPHKCHVAFPQVRQRQTRRSRQQDPAEASVTRVEEQPGSRRWKGHRCCARHEGTMVSLSREISGTCIQCLPHEAERETSGESVLTIERRNRGAPVFLKTHIYPHILPMHATHTCVYTCTHKHTCTLTHLYARAHTLTLQIRPVSLIRAPRLQEPSQSQELQEW